MRDHGDHASDQQPASTGQLTMPRTRVRPAAEADLPELVRLRALLFETLGGDYFNPSTEESAWRRNSPRYCRESPVGLRVHPRRGRQGGLAACAIGSVEQRLPGPHLRNGRVGLVIGVVTDPAHRRRGHSRALMRGWLDWFRECGVARVDLYASHEGEPLYRDLGFVNHPDPALFWRP